MNGQRKDIPKFDELNKKGLEAARLLKFPAVVVLGHPDHYPRFGFKPSDACDISSEYDVPPEVFMALEVQTGALKGLFRIARCHEVFAGL